MPGEGSVYRRRSDGRWVAALSVGKRDSRTIQRRYARSRTEARALLDELRGGPRSRSTLTVGDYLERWVTDVRNIRPTTRHGYEVVVNHHLVPTIGHFRLVDLGPLDVESAIAELAPSMSAKSLRNVHAVLRRALGQAVRADLVPRNVASREFVDAPRVPEQEPRALSVAEVDRLADAVRADRLEALFVLAVDTGLRQGELLGLAWADVEGGYATVRRELTQTGPGPTKTERSKRRVPLSERCQAALVRHRERMMAEGWVPVSTGPLFVNLTGASLNGSWVTHHFYELCERAGIDRLPFKNLRTTFGSRLYDLGVPDRTIADLMGHTRTATTQRHYIATTPEQAIEAIGRLTLTRHSPNVANGS